MENNFFQHISEQNYEFPTDLLSTFCRNFFPLLQADPSNPKTTGRGRKRLRPGNPLKTEVLDKYWLRAFRTFVKVRILAIKEFTNDSDFWTWYLNDGKPGKDSDFLSYNAKYKKELFENRSFSAMFAAWCFSCGTTKIQNKVLKTSWGYYYQYLYQELVPRAFNSATIEEIRICCAFICGNLYQCAGDPYIRNSDGSINA